MTCGPSPLGNAHVAKLADAQVSSTISLSIDTKSSESGGMRTGTKYSKEVLEALVPKCESYAGLLRLLNLKHTGGSHGHLKRMVTRHGIDTSHFKGGGWSRGQAARNRKPWGQVLVIYKTLNPPKARIIQRALGEAGRPYQCENSSCSNKGIWLGKKLTLQVDHRNGNRFDNTPSNIRLLCPNCHSQTENFGNKRQKGQRTRRPPKETLEYLLWERSARQIAQSFGVSDKAVEKWAKFYGITKPPRGYWAKRYAQSSDGGMADTLASEAGAARHEGSNPSLSTKLSDSPCKAKGNRRNFNRRVEQPGSSSGS